MAWVTLIAPRGAEQAPVSHGQFGYDCYPDPTHPHRWLVDVPDYTEASFCNGVGGFVRAPDGLQGKRGS